MGKLELNGPSMMSTHIRLVTFLLAQTICESLVFFFVSSEQVNLIRWFLCDDTFQ